APVDRLEFGKWNMRLKTDLKLKEATFQVVLDALALTPFYQAFLITIEVPAIYMQEFWATITVYKSSIRFTINKKKFSLDVELTSDTSPKKKSVPATKGSRLKSSAKVAKIDKKKQLLTIQKPKGLVVLSEVALTETEQMKLATKRSKTQFHTRLTQVAQVMELTLSQDSEEESWTFSKDEDGKEDGDEVSSDQKVSTPLDHEHTKDDENQEGDDYFKEGEQEKEDEEDLYGYVNINLERSDAKMTDAQVNKDTEDAHVTLTSHTLVNLPAFVTAETPSSETNKKLLQSIVLTPLSLPLKLYTISPITTQLISNKTCQEIPKLCIRFCLIKVDNYLASKMKKAVDVAVQSENQTSLDKKLKLRIKNSSIK
ncbi:hypothetical protein Tco_1108582, partial [Tanacetum coccineum]